MVWAPAPPRSQPSLSLGRTRCSCRSLARAGQDRRADKIMDWSPNAAESWKPPKL